MTPATTAETTSFSARLGAETATDHRGAQRSEFVSALLGGSLSLRGYTDLLVQYRHVYRALEDGADVLAAEATAAPFLSRSLDRVPALEADIADLTARVGGAACDFEATAATEEYAGRIREVTASSSARYVAHHYTRYLGDLSGGFPIGRIAAATYDLTPDHGGRFARFIEIDDPVEFKNTYRRQLDEAPWTEAERDALIDEAHLAYRCNVGLFASLDHHVG